MPPTSLTTARRGDDARPSEATARSADNPICDMCTHSVADHDAIALRFCRATAAAAIARGCVCRPA